MNTIDIFNEISKDDLDYIVKLHKRGILSQNLEPLGTGAFGTVYGYKDYAIKVIYDINDKNNDIDVLLDLSHLDFFPKLYATIDDKIIISERIYGDTVREYVYYDYENSLNLDRSIIDTIKNYFTKIIENGYIPYDMHGSNIMICKKTKMPKIVDLGLFDEIQDDVFKVFGGDTFINNVLAVSNANNLALDELDSYFKDLERKEQKEKLRSKFLK